MDRKSKLIHAAGRSYAAMEMRKFERMKSISHLRPLI